MVHLGHIGPKLVEKWIQQSVPFFVIFFSVYLQKQDYIWKTVCSSLLFYMFLQKGLVDCTFKISQMMKSSDQWNFVEYHCLQSWPKRKWSSAYTNLCRKIVPTSVSQIDAKFSSHEWVVHITLFFRIWKHKKINDDSLWNKSIGETIFNVWCPFVLSQKYSIWVGLPKDGYVRVQKYCWSVFNK